MRVCVCEEKSKRAEREQINCWILPVSPMDSISKYLHCYVCSITDAYSVFSLCQSDCYQGNLRCLCVHACVSVCCVGNIFCLLHFVNSVSVCSVSVQCLYVRLDELTFIVTE